jgi:hypothetical protein
MTIDVENLRKRVDWEQGLISPEIFIDQDIYEEEMERLLGRTWLFLAHDSMIPNPGDFFATYMGGNHSPWSLCWPAEVLVAVLQLRSIGQHGPIRVPSGTGS